MRKICKTCDCYFSTPKYAAKYCSDECRNIVITSTRAKYWKLYYQKNKKKILEKNNNYNNKKKCKN